MSRKRQNWNDKKERADLNITVVKVYRAPETCTCLPALAGSRKYGFHCVGLQTASVLFAQVAFSMHCWCLCRLGFSSISSQVPIWVTFPQPTCIPPSVDGVSLPGPELPLQQKLLINKKKQGTSFLMACQMCIKG